MAVINGTVASPEDAAQAELLVARRSTRVDAKEGGPQDRAGQPAASTATPLQVTLKVRIAEMNRRCSSRSASICLSAIRRRIPVRRRPGQPGHHRAVRPDDDTRLGGSRVSFNSVVGGTTLGLFGKMFGLDLLGTLDLAAEGRPGDDARRAEPDRAVGRNRQLPRRRRIPGPGLAGARRGHDRI